MDKYDVKKLVDDSFIELGYIDVLDKDYIKKCVNDVCIRIKEKQEELDNIEGKCNRPDYIQSLPFDLTTNNIDDLNSRLDEIDSRMDKIWDLMGTIRSDMSDLITKQKNFHKSDEELQSEAFDSIESIHNRYHELFPNGFESKPNVVDLNIGTLNELFEYSGMIDGGQADALMKTAGMLVDYAYEQTDGDDTPWSNRVIGIADDIRALAEKHNVNNNSQSKSLEDYMDIQKELDDTVEVYHSTLKMYHDFKEEGNRTRKKIDKVKKNNSNKKDN